MLKAILENNKTLQFQNFYILSAYARTSGVERLREAIQKFKSTGGKVKAAVGIGQKNTSIQGLESLYSLVNEAWIYHNESRTSTFHPKVYAFEKPNEKAVVFVGSSNLTAGGLFTNYEVVSYSEYDLKNPQQEKKFGEIKELFQFYSTPSEFCKKLNPDLIKEMAEYYLCDETKEDLVEGESPDLTKKVARKGIFGSRRIAPPPLPKSAVISRKEIPIATTEKKEAETRICDWSAKGRIHWRKKLAKRDCQIVSSVTAPTGGLSLTKAKWKDIGKLIDQTTYFRFDVFGEFVWRQARPAYNVETTEVAFCVKIMGKDRGLHRLILRYNPKWESGQNNYTTGLSWGSLTKLINDPALVGKHISIYAPPVGEKEPFFLEIA